MFFSPRAHILRWRNHSLQCEIFWGRAPKSIINRKKLKNCPLSDKPEEISNILRQFYIKSWDMFGLGCKESYNFSWFICSTVSSPRSEKMTKLPLHTYAPHSEHFSATPWKKTTHLKIRQTFFPPLEVLSNLGKVFFLKEMLIITRYSAKKFRKHMERNPTRQISIKITIATLVNFIFKRKVGFITTAL